MGFIVKWAGYVALFLGSFIFFLFLTFPYEVLKETLSDTISKETGFRVRIGELSPNFPLGVEAESIRIDPPGQILGLRFNRLEAGVGVLAIFMGRLEVNATVEQPQGQLDLSVQLGLFEMFKQQFVPRRITLEAEQFPIDNLASFGLNMASSGPGANPMAGQLLGALGVAGRLNGEMDLRLNAADPTASSGEAKLRFADARLNLSDPSLGLPDQVFNKAMVNAKISGGKLQLDDKSGLQSDELRVDLGGNVTLKENLFASQLDLKIVLALEKGLKEKFGWILDAVKSTQSGDGQMTVQVRGRVDRPNFTTF